MKRNRIVHKLVLCMLFILMLMNSRVGQAAEKNLSCEAMKQIESSLLVSSPVRIQKGSLTSQQFYTAPSTPNAFYKELRKQLLKRSEHITLQYSGNKQDIKPNVEDILEKIRQIDDKGTSDDADFLVGSIISMGYTVTYGVNWAEFDFVVRYTDTQAQVKKVNKTVAQVLNQLQVNKLSDVGKVKAIHDYVVNQLDYDRTMTDHSVYGGLIDKKHTTVCQGYALLMYKMLTEAGITTHYVTGYAGEAHAWNVVRLEGKWYALDATWDDPTGGEPILSHEYFLVGSNKLNKDHRTDKIYAKQYPIQKKDYNWKKALNNSNKKADNKVKDQTSKEQEKLEKDAMLRNEYIRTLTEVLDESLNYENASEMERMLLDLYKKVFACVVYDLPENTFQLLLSGDDDVYEQFYQVCSNKINQYIFNPCMEYLESDECFNDTVGLMLQDYSYEELQEMYEEDISELAEAYALDAVNRKISSLSKKYTNRIIKECVEELK